MKRIAVCLILAFYSFPAWADDDLAPEPLVQAIGEYNDLMKSKDVDPMNHEVWKLYIFYNLTPSSGYDKTPKWLVSGLTLDKRYRVVLPINQLYNFLPSTPKPGDVIVVEGHVTSHYDMTVDFDRGLISKRVSVPAFLMYVDGAVNLPRERFDPTIHSPATPTFQLSPTPTPGGSRH